MYDRSAAELRYFDQAGDRMKVATGVGLQGQLYSFRDMKVYTVNATGSCQSYCPIAQGELLQGIQLGFNVVSKGSVVGNKLCDGQAICNAWEGSNKG